MYSLRIAFAFLLVFVVANGEVFRTLLFDDEGMGGISHMTVSTGDVTVFTVTRGILYHFSDIVDLKSRLYIKKDFLSTSCTVAKISPETLQKVENFARYSSTKVQSFVFNPRNIKTQDTGIPVLMDSYTEQFIQKYCSGFHVTIENKVDLVEVLIEESSGAR